MGREFRGGGAPGPLRRRAPGVRFDRAPWGASYPNSAELEGVVRRAELFSMARATAGSPTITQAGGGFGLASAGEKPEDVTVKNAVERLTAGRK